MAATGNQEVRNAEILKDMERKLVRLEAQEEIERLEARGFDAEHGLKQETAAEKQPSREGNHRQWGAQGA